MATSLLKLGRPTRTRYRVALVALVVVVGAIAIMVPISRAAREATRRTSCKCRLKQIALALHNYADVWNGFPPAYTIDESGQRLHSWRTLILPYLDRHGLYDSIDLSKPWDDPVNAAARMTAVSVYECPSLPATLHKTTYLAAEGNEYCLQGGSERDIADITDGVSNTVMVIEVALTDAVEWMDPYDIGAELFLKMNAQSKTTHRQGNHVIMADGLVRFVKVSAKPELRRALLTRNAGEAVGDF